MSKRKEKIIFRTEHILRGRKWKGFLSCRWPLLSVIDYGVGFS